MVLVVDVMAQSQEVLSKSFLEWIQELNYHYMIIFIFLSYGIHHKPQMQWVGNLIGKWTAIWIIGLLIGAGYMMASPKAFIDGSINKEYLALLFHSYGISMTFMDDAIKILKIWGVAINKKIHPPKEQEDGEKTN